MAHPTLDLAVKDRQGNTPFAAALAVKDSETGQAIVQRDPKAAEQVKNYKSFLDLIGRLLELLLHCILYGDLLKLLLYCIL